MQKLSFNEHFSITCGSGINLLIGNDWIFSLIEFGKTIDEDLVCGNFKPMLGCLLVLLVVFSFLKNDFVKFTVGISLKLIFLILVTGSFLKIKH